MIAKELLDELKSVCIEFAWEYCGASRKIRGKLKSQLDGVLFDPIGAVCLSKTGLVFDDNHWLDAAEQIQLSSIDAADLIAAANNVRTHMDCSYTQSLRRRIIDRVLLQPETGLATGFATEFLSLGSLSLFRRTVRNAKSETAEMSRRG